MKFVFIFLFFIAGCSTAPPSSLSTTPTIYEMTLSGTLDGIAFSGVGLGSTAAKHQITLTSTTSIDMFTAKSCHRSVDDKDAINNDLLGRWLQIGKSFTFSYTESPGIEDTGICPLEVCAYSKTVGQLPVDCAMIAFKNSKFVLPAKNVCNGSAGQASGTMLCKSEVGLQEQVQFSGPTLVAPPISISGNIQNLIPNQCAGSFVDAAQTIYQYTVPLQNCALVFMEKASPNRMAVLTVIPFNAHAFQ